MYGPTFALPQCPTNPISTIAKAETIDRPHPSIAPDANLFSDLLETEKDLDWTLSRGRQEVKDATSKDLTVRGIHQPISVKGRSANERRECFSLIASRINHGGVQRSEPTVNFETGRGAELDVSNNGKLLDVSNQLYLHFYLTTLSSTNRSSTVKKLSHRLHTLSIETEGDPTLYPESNEHE